MSLAELRLSRFDMTEMPLFRNVTPESVDGLLEHCHIKELRKNDVLMRQGEVNHHLYIVLSGELSIHLDSPDSSPIALLGRGETVGEMSLIDHKVVSAYVIAAADSRLMMLDEDMLWSLVWSSHAASCNLLGILTSRLRNANIVLSDRMQLEYDFHQYGTVDALTGLHNRYWLNHTLPRLIKRHDRTAEPLSMIMTDIDLFKEFNTKYGHLCGDHVIHAVARVLMDRLRPSEMAARYGGDEFVILLPRAALHQARIAAERLRVIVDNLVIQLPDGTTVPTPTISVGVAQHRPGDCADYFISTADAAMYRAKEKGRDMVSD